MDQRIGVLIERQKAIYKIVCSTVEIWRGFVRNKVGGNASLEESLSAWLQTSLAL